MSLAEKVEDAYISLVGNKVTLLTSSLLAASAYSIADNFYEHFANNNFSFLSFLGFGMLGSISGMINLGTKFGAGTLYFYRRTEEHIERYGELKPRVVELWMKHKTENEPEFGYCQQQGIYLAARKHGQLEAFYEAKERVSKVKIPHF